jgi:hypothetical protein
MIPLVKSSSLIQQAACSIRNCAAFISPAMPMSNAPSMLARSLLRDEG